MTTNMLAGISSVLEERSPIVGVPAEAEAAARTLAYLCEELDLGHREGGHAVTCLSYLKSNTVSTILAELNERLLPGMMSLADDLWVGSQAFGHYADDIERIHVHARVIVADVESHLGRIRSCAVELEQAAATLRLSLHRSVPSLWHRKPDLWPPTTPQGPDALTPAELAARAWATATWTAQALAWACAVDRIQEQQREWRRLIAERCEVEQRLLAALRDTGVGKVVALTRTPDPWAITRHVTGGVVHPSRLQADSLLSGVVDRRMTPPQVAAAWRELSLSESELEALPTHTLFALARADGVPLRVQDFASRTALTFSEQHPEEALHLLGISTNDMSVSEFISQISDLRQALNTAEHAAIDLPGSPLAQLLGFGAHDGSLVAAISLGNLDEAGHLAVNVSGMNSNVSSLDESVKSSQTLYLETIKANPAATPATVAWLGYRSPNPVEVFNDNRAASGAVPLAQFIDGINSSRDEACVMTHELVLLAHSYGSTTSAEALKITSTRGVDSFIIYGSAGLTTTTEVEQLHAERVYATTAKGDQIAGIGISKSGRIDPRDIPGVVEFSSEGGDEGTRVTMHGMYAEERARSVFNPAKRGYLSAGTESAASMGRVIAGMNP